MRDLALGPNNFIESVFCLFRLRFMKNTIVITSIFVALISTSAFAQKKVKAQTAKEPVKTETTAEPVAAPVVEKNLGAAEAAETKTEETTSPVAMEPTPVAPASTGVSVWPRSLIGV